MKKIIYLGFIISLLTALVFLKIHNEIISRNSSFQEHVPNVQNSIKGSKLNPVDFIPNSYVFYQGQQFDRKLEVSQTINHLSLERSTIFTNELVDVDFSGIINFTVLEVLPDKSWLGVKFISKPYIEGNDELAKELTQSILVCVSIKGKLLEQKARPFNSTVSLLLWNDILHSVIFEIPDAGTRQGNSWTAVYSDSFAEYETIYSVPSRFTLDRIIQRILRVSPNNLIRAPINLAGIVDITGRDRVVFTEKRGIIKNGKFFRCYQIPLMDSKAIISKKNIIVRYSEDKMVDQSFTIASLLKENGFDDFQTMKQNYASMSVDDRSTIFIQNEVRSKNNLDDVLSMNDLELYLNGLIITNNRNYLSVSAQLSKALRAESPDYDYYIEMIHANRDDIRLAQLMVNAIAKNNNLESQNVLSDIISNSDSEMQLWGVISSSHITNPNEKLVDSIFSFIATPYDIDNKNLNLQLSALSIFGVMINNTSNSDLKKKLLSSMIQYENYLDADIKYLAYISGLSNSKLPESATRIMNLVNTMNDRSLADQAIFHVGKMNIPEARDLLIQYFYKLNFIDSGPTISALIDQKLFFDHRIVDILTPFIFDYTIINDWELRLKSIDFMFDFCKNDQRDIIINMLDLIIRNDPNHQIRIHANDLLTRL